MKSNNVDFLVLISAGAEWRAVMAHIPGIESSPSPIGQYFIHPDFNEKIIFLHGGWGKISTSAAAQYAIDRWQPKLMINLGTCGGIDGKIHLNEIVLAEETLIYDIIEGMGNYQAGIEKYTTLADLAWLGEDFPVHLTRTRLLSADRDIRPEDAVGVIKDFDGAVADWESGAFAWVCARNQVDWLVLRGVSDLVSADEAEALGNKSLWQSRTIPIMQTLVSCLPWLFERYRATHS